MAHVEGVTVNVDRFGQGPMDSGLSPAHHHPEHAERCHSKWAIGAATSA